MAVRVVQRSLDGGEIPTNHLHSRIGTFAPNLSLPVHRWFRFPAGFSGEWVEGLLANTARDGFRVLDPFAGTGSTLVAAQHSGLTSVGLEPHPFLSRVAQAKLLWPSNPTDFARGAGEVLEKMRPSEPSTVAPLLNECYPAGVLRDLLGLRDAIGQSSAPEAARRLLWLALMAILRRCSPVGTAQWQYILPSRRKAETERPRVAFREQVELMVHDMRLMQRGKTVGEATLYPEDARASPSLRSNWADLVVTSPPYPNNYDYADAVRLELTFLGEVVQWGDLSTRVRPFLIRSCSQHVGSGSFEALLDSPGLAPVREELRLAYARLENERQAHGGRKTYHSMVAAYFYDLALAWAELRRACRAGSRVCFVIGDSAPYGVYLPVERWLGDIAVHAGFREWRFEKLRDRNTKWLNRKHRVPLKEGLLWVGG